ncbi:unnamed protein product [Rotaria sp. Silwood1]|nr:unnamed protein product [Rotaria sp. Silwood1]CAF4701606.1 unnamed protein product [Rotaria sp. Silwood1]
MSRALLRIISNYAQECHVKIQIKQAFIQENLNLTNLKINDHNDMSFRLGQAIEFELIDQNNKLLCNQICLQKKLSYLKVLPDVKWFSEKISKKSDLRQDAIKPRLLMKRPKPGESLIQLEDKRKDVQNKYSKLKMKA